MAGNRKERSEVVALVIELPRRIMDELPTQLLLVATLPIVAALFHLSSSNEKKIYPRRRRRRRLLSPRCVARSSLYIRAGIFFGREAAGYPWLHLLPEVSVALSHPYRFVVVVVVVPVVRRREELFSLFLSSLEGVDCHSMPTPILLRFLSLWWWSSRSIRSSSRGAEIYR